MKEIAIFEAFDGARFDKNADCILYEQLLEDLKRINAILGSNDFGIGFYNGTGYLQHSLDSIAEYRAALTDATVAFGHDRASCNSGFITRILDDSATPSSKALAKAWYRLECIDGQSREWGQLYYANHPHRAKHVQLNANKQN